MFTGEISSFFFLVAVECHQYSQFDAWATQQMVVNISDPVPTDGLCVRSRVCMCCSDAHQPYTFHLLHRCGKYVC